MTGIDTGTALLILVVFVLPGFVAVLVRERIYEVRVEEATFDRLLTSVYYSLLIWAVPTLVAIAAGAERADVERFLSGRASLWLTGAVAIGVLLVLPALMALVAWAWIGCRWRMLVLRWLALPEDHSVRTAWDFSFDDEDDVWLVVALRHASRIAGHYGRRSHSGYGTRTRDLFLEQRWILDDHERTVAPVPNNCGVWINAEEIVAVERYDSPYADQAMAKASSAP